MASAWINDIFKAASVKNGNIVRRKVADVKKLGSADDLIQEVKNRGFHMVEIGDQYVIICNPGNMKVIC